MAVASRAIQPMLAVSAEVLPEGPGWSYEFKWDGIRALVSVAGGQVAIQSRSGRDITGGYPELAGLGPALGSRSVVLDGEVVALDAENRPSFGNLQARMQIVQGSRAQRLAAATPATYFVFDLLYLDDRPTVDLPYRERRRLLAGLGLAGPRWGVPPVAEEGRGADVLETACANGLEGVVAKRTDSPYELGRRSSRWVKVKCFRAQEVVIGGWTPGQGRRTALIGALLLGVPSAAGLAYVGKVGTGFTHDALTDLAAALAPLQRSTSPFLAVPRPEAARATWVEPRLVGEVRFGEWTRDGRLRHPAWRGLRPDKEPDQILRET